MRRREHGRVTLVAGALAAIGAGLIGAGVIELPNVEHLIEEAGQALGKWTYLAVGLLAFLETGAFIGLVAPGETTVIVGGLVAGQGVISLTILIAVVWACAVAGDVTSYLLGRRLGRDFMVRHGARVKITEERLEHVERFFERRGGMTILIGRFIGLVRAIAPFIAGASRMPLRKFLPYDILGAGLWATTFCVLGYVFWRSFDQLTSWVSRGLFAFGLVVALIVGIVFLVRLQRNPELRARTAKWIDAQLEKPLLRPFAPALRAAWQRIVRPAAGAAEGPARFVWNRITPGDFGLEVTTLLAAGAVGSFVFFLLADMLDERELLPGDRLAADVAARIDVRVVEGVAEVLSVLRLAPGRGADRRGHDRLGVRAAPLPRGGGPAARARADLARRRGRQGRGRPPAPGRPPRRDDRLGVSLGPRRVRRPLRRVRDRARPRGQRAGGALRGRDVRDRARRGARALARAAAREPPLRRRGRRRPGHRDPGPPGGPRDRRRPPASQWAAGAMTNDTWTYIAIGGAALVSLIAWVTLILVPAWTSYTRVWDRLVAAVLSLYVLAAFAGVGLLLGGAFLWYFDEL